MEHLPAGVGEMQEPLAGWGLAPGWWGACMEKKSLAAGGAGAFHKVQVQQALLRAWGAVAVAPVHYAKKDRKRKEGEWGQPAEGYRERGQSRGHSVGHSSLEPTFTEPLLHSRHQDPLFNFHNHQQDWEQNPQYSDVDAELLWLNDHYTNTESL